VATAPAALELLRVACATRQGDLARTVHELQHHPAAEKQDSPLDALLLREEEERPGLTQIAALELRRRWQLESSNDAKDANTQYVGLKNQGCTCYMNSTLQQLFMIEPLRRAVLSAEVEYATKLPGTHFDACELEDEAVLVEWVVNMSPLPALPPQPPSPAANDDVAARSMSISPVTAKEEAGASSTGEGERVVVWRPATVIDWNPEQEVHTVRFDEFLLPESVVDHTSSISPLTAAAAAPSPPSPKKRWSLAGGELCYHLLKGGETGSHASATGRVVVYRGAAAPSLALANATPLEQTTRVLEQMQRTFLHLSRSEKRSFDPRPLVEASTCMALEYNVFQQNDAPEFYDKLMQKLESALKPHKEAFTAYQQCFGLEVANQSIPKEQTSRFKAREKGDTLMKLELKVAGGIESVEDGLAELVEDEVMDGDNKIEFEDEAGVTDKLCGVRRTCVSKLPNVLVLHLKRFALDFTTFETVKVNDRCAFPLRLDMKPYTKEGMAERDAHAAREQEREEQEKAAASRQENQPPPSPPLPPQGEESQHTGGSSTASSSSSSSSSRCRDGEEVPLDDPSAAPPAATAELDDEDFLYNLRGVLIHAGVSQSGHYYSFIKDKATGQWYRFDDDDVTPWDVKDLEKQCFGGKVVKTVERGNGLPDQRQEKELIANALMVFYDKAKAVELDDDDGDSDVDAKEKGNSNGNDDGASSASAVAPGDGDASGAAALGVVDTGTKTAAAAAGGSSAGNGGDAAMLAAEGNDSAAAAASEVEDVLEPMRERSEVVLSGFAAFEGEVHASNLRFRRLGYLFDAHTHAFIRAIMAGTAGVALPSNPGKGPNQPLLFPAVAASSSSSSSAVAAATAAAAGSKGAETETEGGGGTSSLQLQVLQFCLGFFLDVVLHSRERRATQQWVQLCKAALAKHAAFSSWFVDVLVGDRNANEHWLRDYLAHCPDFYARRAFVDLVAAACLALAPLETPFLEAEARRAAAAANLWHQQRQVAGHQQRLHSERGVLQQLMEALARFGVDSLEEEEEAEATTQRGLQVQQLQHQARAVNDYVERLERFIETELSRVAEVQNDLRDAIHDLKEAVEVCSAAFAAAASSSSAASASASSSPPSSTLLLCRRAQVSPLRPGSIGSVGDFVRCLTTTLLPSSSSSSNGGQTTDESFLLVQLLAEGSPSIRKCLVAHDAIARLSYAALGHNRSPAEVRQLCSNHRSAPSRDTDEEEEREQLVLGEHLEPVHILEAVAALVDVPQVERKPLLADQGAGGWQLDCLTSETERALTTVFQEFLHEEDDDEEAVGARGGGEAASSAAEKGRAHGPAVTTRRRMAMDFFDLNRYLEATRANPPSKYELQTILATYGDKGFLTLPGFLRYYCVQAITNPKEVWSHLYSFRFRSDLTRPGDNDKAGGGTQPTNLPGAQVKEEEEEGRGEGNEATAIRNDNATVEVHEGKTVVAAAVSVASDGGSTLKLLPKASRAALTSLNLYEVAARHRGESVPGILRKAFTPPDAGGGGGEGAERMWSHSRDLLKEGLDELSECWAAGEAFGGIAFTVLSVLLQVQDGYQRDRAEFVLWTSDKALLQSAMKLIQGRGVSSPRNGEDRPPPPPPQRAPTNEEWWLVGRYVRVLGKLFEQEGVCKDVLRSEAKVARTWENVQQGLLLHERQLAQLQEQQRMMRQLQAQPLVPTLGCGGGGGGWGAAVGMLNAGGRSPPTTIEVVNAGADCVNGTYKLYPFKCFDESPCWIMSVPLGNEVMTLYRCCLEGNQHVWYFSYVEMKGGRIEPGTSEDQDFYMANSTTKVVGPSAPREIEPPPSPAWESVSPDGFEPTPEIILGDDDAELCDYDDEDED